MTPNAIKKYLHSVTITKKEAELIKDLLQENNEELKDLLPADKKKHKYFLTDLLSASLKDHKNNKDFINTILSLKNEDNKDSFYYCLSNNKYGLELIKANPTLFNDDIDKSFAEILNKGSGKAILEFIRENKEKINIETVYKSNLDIKVVQGIEKEGFTFDHRILNVVICKANLKKPADLLQYMENFKSSTDEKIWNNSIISMLSYYSREIWDWNGRDKFGDSLCLITKLKNPSQYRWGQELNTLTNFSFIHCVESYCNEEHRNRYPSITGGNPIDLGVMRKFFKNNDIHFDSLWNIKLFKTFINEFSDDVVNNAIKNNWTSLFRFENNKYDKHGRYREDIVFDSLYKDKENPLLKNERVVKAILKEYFAQPTYRFDSYNAETFFEWLGLSADKIKNKKVLLKYSDILFQENIKHICEALKMKESVATKIATEFQVDVLHKELQINEADPKKKQFKI